MNTNQMHFNAEYAARSEFGRPLVVSTLTVAIAVGQSVTDLTQNAFANLGLGRHQDDPPGLRRRHALQRVDRAGEARVRQSRPHAGIVTVRTRTLNQDGAEVCSFKRTFYVYKRGAEQLRRRLPRQPRSRLTLDGRVTVPMRLTYGPWGETLAELVDACRRAEDAGAEVLWVPELHRSATVAAAAHRAGHRAAPGWARRSRLAFTRSPMVTALEALDLDEMSGGRFRARSRHRRAAAQRGLAQRPVGQARRAPARDGAQRPALLGALHLRRADRPATGEYEPMRIQGYQRPFPVARTRIPIYLAAMGPAMTRLAGRDRRRLDQPRALLTRPTCASGSFPSSRPASARTEGKAARTSTSSSRPAARSTPTGPSPATGSAGLVGFYASVRTYADFFDFHGLARPAAGRASTPSAAGRGADHLADAVTPTTWSTRSP